MKRWQKNLLATAALVAAVALPVGIGHQRDSPRECLTLPRGSATTLRDRMLCGDVAAVWCDARAAVDPAAREVCEPLSQWP